jgi:hypothetical protein
MAKVVYSPQVGDMRNKTGGAVHTKTRFGSMVRRKVSPTQPRSSAQMNVRANFTALSKLWSDPTMDNYRAGWIGLADSYPVKDVFGQSQKLTGHQMFVRLNRALATVGIAAKLIPPSSLSASYPGALTIVATGAPVTVLTVAPTTVCAASELALVLATPGISRGRAGAGARFRLIGVYSDSPAPPWDIKTAYTNKFGAPISGRKCFIRIIYTSGVTGAQSIASEKEVTFA